MKRWLLAFLLFASPAFAAEQDPCHREGVSLNMLGVDLDAIKCSERVYQEKVANAAVRQAQMEATLRLMQSDVADAQKKLQDLQKWVHDYFAH